MRLLILEALRSADSATGVARRLGLPRQKVNYHVRELERMGVVAHVEDRQRGGCTERLVRATATHWLIAPSVLGELEARPELTEDRHSSAHLAAVSARTVSEVAELRERAADAGKRLATYSLESAVRFAGPEAQHAFAEELAEAVAAVVARHHDATAEGGRWFRLVVGAHPALKAPDAAAPTATHDDDDHENEREEEVR